MRLRAGRLLQATNGGVDATRRVDEVSLCKMQNTGEALRCWKNRSNAALRGCSRSERAQQDRADERKYGEHRQHVEPQRKIHVTSSPCVLFRSANLTEGGRNPNDKCGALPKASTRI